MAGENTTQGSGIGNFFANLFSFGLWNYVNGIQQEDQYNLSEQSAESAFRRSLYAWRLNNDYNSPTNQMARLKEAGLNPHLVSSNISSTSSTPQVLPGKTFSMAPQQDFVANFIRLSEMLTDIGIKKQDAEIRKISAEDDHKIKQAQADNILQDTILKQVGVKKGNYEYSNWYPKFTSRYQEEVHKLGNENYLLYLQGQRQKMENQIRQYWKDRYMMSDFQFDNMMKEYSAKSQKYRYTYFLPLEKEIMGYNRDIRKQEFDYLASYGTTSPGSGSFMGVPVSAIMSPTLGVSAINTGKKIARTVGGLINGLFNSGDRYFNGFFDFDKWQFQSPNSPNFWRPWYRRNGFHGAGGKW